MLPQLGYGGCWPRPRNDRLASAMIAAAVASVAKCRGPLNTVPSPQGRPTYVQAGGSPRGRDFAAKHADSIIATANEISGMKQFRDDVRARAAKLGRNPDDIKILYLVYPFLGETREEAKAQHQRLLTEPSF